MATDRDRLNFLRELDSLSNEVSPAPETKKNKLIRLREKEKKEGDKSGIGITEAVASIASSVVAEPISGLSGIVQTLNPFAEPGAGSEAVSDVKEMLTYKPKTQFGVEKLNEVAEMVSPVTEKFTELENALGDYAFKTTGSPAIAAAAKSSPTAILEVLGIGGLKGIKSGTRLIDDMGRPTKELDLALDKYGLNYDNLNPDIRAEIPDISNGTLLPRADKTNALKVAENALVKQIKSGGRDDSLAGLKVINGKVKPDDLGVEAIKQGFDSGFIQAAKTASPDTKKGLLKMINITEQINKNKRLSMDMRPTDIVGDAVASRIKFIKKTADNARSNLNKIAESELKGLDVDVSPVVNKLQETLDIIDVDLVGDGVPKLNFKGSMISKDKTSQRVINDLIDLMSEGGKPDALRLHKLKRQIDALINFKKKSAGGLTDSGRNVLKDIRRSLNGVLREYSVNYADVNDILSSSLDALDDFKKVSGSNIDIFGSGSEKAIGQDMRGLMSNRKSRVRLEESLNKINDVASDLGGKFNNDIKDLSLFANELENRFGAIADTSLKGELSSAIDEAATKTAAQTMKDKAFKKAAEKANKLKGINNFNAYRAIRAIANEN